MRPAARAAWLPVPVPVQVQVKLRGADTYSLLNLIGSSPAAPRDLSLAADACVMGVGAGVLLAGWPCGDEGSDEVVWLPLHERAEPEVLSPGAVVSYDPALGMAVLDLGTGEALRLLHIDRHGHRLQPLLVKNEDYGYGFHFSPDAQGLVIVTMLGPKNVADYYPIDLGTGDLQTKVPLAVGARAVKWQPWR